MWCPGPESNRHALRRGIFFPLRLSPPSPPKRRRSWAGARLHHSLSALGARRLLSTPSEKPFSFRAWLGISSDLRPGPSPSLTGFTSGVSPGGLKFGLSPLRLPISPPGQNCEAVYNTLPRTPWQEPPRIRLVPTWLLMQRVISSIRGLNSDLASHNTNSLQEAHCRPTLRHPRAASPLLCTIRAVVRQPPMCPCLFAGCAVPVHVRKTGTLAVLSTT